MRKRMAAAVAAGSPLLGAAATSPALAATKTPKLQVVCDSPLTDSTPVNGVCVMASTIVDPADDYLGFIAINNAEEDTFAVVSGTLPPGLTMPSSYGAAGTLTQMGTFTFTVQGTDGTGQALSQAGPPPLAVNLPASGPTL